MKNNSLQTSLGAIIRDLRLQADLSQEGFADEVGLHRTYIGAIERGERNVSLQNLQRIANALEVPLSELFHRVENHLSNAEGGVS